MIWRKGSLLWTSHTVVQIITIAVSFCFLCLLFSFYDSGYVMCMLPALFYLANVFFFPHIYFVVFALSPVWLIVRLFARLSVITSWGVSASFCSLFKGSGNNVTLKIIQCLLSYIIICWACISRRVTFFVRTSSHWFAAIMRQQFIMYKFNDYTFTDI